jgi:hypothetical protein
MCIPAPPRRFVRPRMYGPILPAPSAQIWLYMGKLVGSAQGGFRVSVGFGVGSGLAPVNPQPSV